MRRIVWPRSTASRPGSGSTSATRNMHFPCSMCMQRSKMSLRKLVLVPTTVACMGGITTTMAPNECCGMARDKRFTPAMRAATTHVGTGGNPKVGVPVGFVRPSPFVVSPFWPNETCLTCSPSHCLPLSFSPVSSAKAKPAPYEDRRAPASPAVPLPQSEGTNAALVRESAADVSVSLSELPASLSLRSSVSWSLPPATVFVFSSSSPVVRTDKARQAAIKRQDRTRPTRTRPHKARPDTSRPAVWSRLFASRFACPTRYDDLASSSDDDDEPSSPVCSQLSMPADPFSALRTPPSHYLGISRLVRP